MRNFYGFIFIVFSLTTNIFSQVQFTSHLIAYEFGARSVYSIDVDCDGDMDVLSAGEIKIVWHENDGNENFTSHTITTNAEGAQSLYALDVDGDGDIDVLSASLGEGDGEIAWYENDGNENFISHTIATNEEFTSVYAVDVDNDGDMDVLSASEDDFYFHIEIAWYENDGNENFTPHTIKAGTDCLYSVYAVDVDSDGDIDVLSASFHDNKINWYENDGDENFISHTIATNEEFTSVYALDLDGDGDMDVLSDGGYIIAWYENDGSENFTQHIILSSVYAGRSVYAEDVDNDGDMDVLSTDRYEIAWYENDGNENFTHYTLTSGEDSFQSVYALDVDSDGDIDVLSASFYEIAWYEHLSPVGIDDNNSLVTPAQFQLFNNYPNPFNPITKINYQIPELNFVTLKVYDVLGREVVTLVNEEKSIGTYEVEWNAVNLPSGIYFYRLRAGSFIETKKMVLMK